MDCQQADRRNAPIKGLRQSEAIAMGREDFGQKVSDFQGMLTTVSPCIMLPSLVITLRQLICL